MNIKEFFDKIAQYWDEENSTVTENGERIIRSLPIKKGDKVLDVACGTGKISSLLYGITEEEVDAIDISDRMISIATKKGIRGVSFSVADFYHVRGSYDAVVIFDAYPHFVEKDSFVEACVRSVKRGGYLCIAHDLSRVALDECHAGVPEGISRSLLSPKEEARLFEGHFFAVRAEEDDSSYLLVLRKN